MIKLFFNSLIVYLVVLIPAQAQELKYLCGDKINAEEESSFMFCKMDATNLYTLTKNMNDYYIEIYRRDSLKKTDRVKVPVAIQEKPGFNFEKLIVRSDTFQVLYSWFDNKNSSELLEMVDFDISGNRVGDIKLIDQSLGKTEKSAGSFSIIENQLKGGFISYIYKHGSTSDYIDIDNFDYAGNKLFNHTILLNDDSKWIVNSIIGDDNKLYHLVRSKAGNRNVKWSVRIYSPDEDSARVIPLTKATEEDVRVSNFCTSFIGSDGSVNLLSTYSLKGYENNSLGFYLVQIDPVTETLVKEKVIPFKVNGQKADDSEFALSSCIIVAVVTYDVNRYRIVLESRLEVTSSLYGIPVEREYDIGNIITADFNADFEITEIHKIRKIQHTTKPYFKYTGFSILNGNGKSYYIYNELPVNLERTPDKFKKVNSNRIDDTAIIYTSVDNGKVYRKILIDKLPDSGIDAVLPYPFFRSDDKREVYFKRQIKNEFYLMKVYAE